MSTTLNVKMENQNTGNVIHIMIPFGMILLSVHSINQYINNLKKLDYDSIRQNIIVCYARPYQF